jgi:hypothetical protein
MDKFNAAMKLSEIQPLVKQRTVSVNQRDLKSLQRPNYVPKKEQTVNVKAVMCSMDILMMANLRRFSETQLDLKLTHMVKNKFSLDQKLSAAMMSLETLLMEKLNHASVLNQRKKFTSLTKISLPKSALMKVVNAIARLKSISVSLVKISQI